MPAMDFTGQIRQSIEALSQRISVPNRPIGPSRVRTERTTAHSPSFWGSQDGLRSGR